MISRIHDARTFLTSIAATAVCCLALIGAYSLATDSDKMCRPGTTHSVQSGETLWDIATQYDLSAETLKEFNGKEVSSLETDELLSIPVCE